MPFHLKLYFSRKTTWYSNIKVVDWYPVCPIWELGFIAVADLRGVRGCICNPLAASNVFLRTYWQESIKWLYSSGMHQQLPGTVTHSLSVPYWSPDVCLDLELLRDIQFRLPANSLDSYDNNYVCHKCIYVTGSAGNSKNFGHTLHASGWTSLSKFLNPPLHSYEEI